MLPQWTIEKKRDGGILTRKEIRAFIHGFTKGKIPDYQMSALAMAIYFQAMNADETADLTEAMIDSGDRIDSSGIAKPKVDKHSTGGIGDKVSLVLAPLLASLGLAVPMISGRGLGITGGTLDKLESIPGFNVYLEEKDFLRVVDVCGCAIIGQSEKLVPADMKLYGLRGVTGTVPSVPLITASILSKKLAEGIDHLVLDVKCGRGSFMKSQEEARTLARTMVAVGTGMGKGLCAEITAMDEPLGRKVGNALEVTEALECLQGKGPADLEEVVTTLAARLLILAGKEGDVRSAVASCRKAFASGAALARFKRMVELQAGDLKAFETNPALTAKYRQAVATEKAGFVAEVDAERIGNACLLLGAGRTEAEGSVDHAVGVSNLKKVGEPVASGEPLAVIHANGEKRLTEAVRIIETGFTVGERSAPIASRILETVSAGDVAP